MFFSIQTNVKLEDDNILADILGELDGSKGNAVNTTSHSSSSLQTKQEEKNRMNEYMASFSKKHDLKEVDTAGDDVGSCLLLLVR